MNQKRCSADFGSENRRVKHVRRLILVQPCLLANNAVGIAVKVQNQDSQQMAPDKGTEHGKKTIILAGATGDLGGRIARSLPGRGARVRAIIRPGSAGDKTAALQREGVSVVEVDFTNGSALTEACAGGHCVVSALSGLRDVIVDGQTLLLDAAVMAGVPRFIPSDYPIDFTRLPDGGNFHSQWHVYRFVDWSGPGGPVPAQPGYLLE